MKKTDQNASTSKDKQVYLETLGCAKNRVDSEIMLTALSWRGYTLTPDPAAAEIIIVNTCAFLSEASQESVDRILALSENKGSGACENLVVAGCLTERYRESLLNELPEVDGLLGSSDFQQVPDLLDELYSGGSKRVFLNKRPHYAHYETRERIQTTPTPYVYVKIGEGCSNMCSFCNIPFLRGYFSSRTIDSVVEEVQGHVARGVKEINLISQDSSSYGVDLKDSTRLATLLKALDDIPGDFWVRLFYAYPNTFDEEVMEVMSGARHIVPYLDMPFQHINDTVLRDMNRRISESEIREKLVQLKEKIPGLTLRTTFITGFPTEGEKEYSQLFDFIGESWFDHVGVFTYSEEDNISARKFGDPVTPKEKHARRAALLEAQQIVSAKKNAERVGKTLDVLVEGASEETDLLLQGRASFQGPEVDGIVLINEGEATPGAFHRVEITDTHVYDLVGRII